MARGRGGSSLWVCREKRWCIASSPVGLYIVEFYFCLCTSALHNTMIKSEI